MTSPTYHHGNLHNALLDAVGDIIAEDGVGAVSLRGAARRAGVSHSAPAHHFGDKAGMLTAYAIRGFELFQNIMREALSSAPADDPHQRLNALGQAYVSFAISHAPYFDVMFRKELHNPGDPAFRKAAEAGFGVLMGIVSDMQPVAGFTDEQALVFAIKSWTLVHGVATLHIDGALGMFTDTNPHDLLEGMFSLDDSAITGPTP